MKAEADLALSILKDRADRMTAEVNEYIGVRAPAHIREIRRRLRRFNDLSSQADYSRDDLLYLADVLKARAAELALAAKLMERNPELVSEEIIARAAEQQRCLAAERVLRSRLVTPAGQAKIY